jgi:hypothetical protein
MKSLAEYFRDRESARVLVRKTARKQARAGHVMSPTEQRTLLRRILRKLDS